MSNKIRLQTNNTNLQALIDKANTLPDAGGSGGGSVETCTVKFGGKTPPGTEIYYLDQAMTLQYATVNGNTEYTILKDTIFIVLGYSDTTLDGYSSICGNSVVRGFLATK
jgi:hypothetical protein